MIIIYMITICWLFLCIIGIWGSSIDAQIQVAEELMELYRKKVELLRELKEKGETNEMVVIEEEQYFPLDSSYMGEGMHVEGNLVFYGGSVWEMGKGEKFGEVGGKVLGGGHGNVLASKGGKVYLVKVGGSRLVEEYINIQIADPHLVTKYHHPNIITQIANLTLLIHTVSGTHTFSFNSPLLSIFSSRHHELLYVTETQMGHINLPSFQHTQIRLNNTIMSVYQVPHTSILYLVSTNQTLIKMNAQSNSILGQYSLEMEGRINVVNVGGYVVVWGDKSTCFSMLKQEALPLSRVRFRGHKEICIPKVSDPPYKFIFYQYHREIRVILSVNQTISHYLLLLRQAKKQESNFWIPWQIPVIIIVIIIILMCKRKSSPVPKASHHSQIEDFLQKLKSQ